MAQATRYASGAEVDHTPGTAVTAGDVVVVGSNLVGIANRAIPASTLGALATEGVFDIVKATGSISEGDSIYWDADGDPVGGTAGSGAATTTATGNTYLGAALADALSGGATVRVLKTKQPAVTANNALASIIADPGDAGAIPVTGSGSVSLVTAGAETRTVADPTFVGQQLSLGFKTDGGDCVVTAASPVNQAGNNTLTFADVGDHLQLTAIEDGADIEWRIAANDGVALSTV
jgi:predicted RecA/RadA family phage recombinase